MCRRDPGNAEPEPNVNVQPTIWPESRVEGPDTEMTDAELAQYQRWRNSQAQG